MACARRRASRSWSRSRQSPDTRQRDRTWRWRCPPRSCTWRRWRLWLGGLVVLGLAVLPALRRGTIADAGLRRWSITAYSCVICLVVTGEYQASRQISPVQALWSHPVRRLVAGQGRPGRGHAGRRPAGRAARHGCRGTGPPGPRRAAQRGIESSPPSWCSRSPRSWCPSRLDHLRAAGHAVRAAGRRPRQRAHRHDPPRRPGHDPAHPDRRGRSRAGPHRDRHAVVGSGGRAAPHPAPPHRGRLAVGHQRHGRPAAGGVDAHPRRRPRPGRRVRRPLPATGSGDSGPPGP